MISLISLQIFAHLVSDFYLQTQKSCQNKADNAFRSRSLYIHALITFICSWLFSFMIGFLLAAKSLLRFRENDSVKSEYVLVGTLLGFGMAIATGACVLLLLKTV